MSRFITLDITVVANVLWRYQHESYHHHRLQLKKLVYAVMSNKFSFPVLPALKHRVSQCNNLSFFGAMCQWQHTLSHNSF